MGLSTINHRSVRLQISNIYHFKIIVAPRPYSTASGELRAVKRHPHNELYLGLATTTGKGRNAVKAFFSEPKTAKNPSSLYASFTLVIPTGDRCNENVFFIKQEETPTVAGQIANFHRMRIYDSTPNRNLNKIGEKFATLFKRREAFVYSQSIHGVMNWKGLCGHYAWLEIFLNFESCENPFKRNISLDKPKKYTGVGHHGPQMYNPYIPYVRKNRNRGRPKNQTATNSNE